MNNAIDVRGLTKRYADFTLDGLNLTLPSGCILGLIGENGAGKSTVIKLMLDLIRRDAGEIEVLGRDPCTGGCALREQIGVVMDESSFPDNLTAADIDRILKRCYRTWDSAAFFRYAAQFALPPKKPVKTYSRGMKMKLSIAAALSHNSRLLILDEATSGLDPLVRDEILDVFLEFIQDEAHSVLISSHILSDLEKICDYIAFLHKGRLLFCEPKDELLENYVLVKASADELKRLKPGAVAGARKNSFGAEALVRRADVPPGMVTDRASIEDIMLYLSRGERL